jgi:hypothetical protein
MISNHDRSGYFGASDVQYVIGNWKTKTFEKWWLQKLGINRDHFENEFTKAGTNWEHRILDSLHIPNLEKDKQIIIDRLRVNLDGNTNWKIYEVKTYKHGTLFKVSKAYWMQVQVQMFASGIRKACIVAYALKPEDYKNHNRVIDIGRISYHDIIYDRDFIEKYKRRLAYLTACLKAGIKPEKNMFKD